MTQSDAQPRPQRCENCRYAETTLSPDDPDAGECRRYPPVLSCGGKADFPKVRRADWCGEWVLV
jgi:hypothetical protein